jgi:diguanylate cyclase (GGDEF)-like protein
MNKEEYEIEEIIRIVLNNENKIIYSSINANETQNYLKKLDIFNKLSKVSRLEYCMENYRLTTDEIKISDQKYYFVTIDSSKHKCSECSESGICNKALIDSVTGLYNRNFWELINNGSIYYPFITKYFTLILIDIDNLKEINDSFGHLMGDEVIKIVGQSIKKSIRKEDLGVRYGGDEFITLLFNQDRETANRVIERIKNEINKISIERRINIQISTGVGCYDCLKNIGDIMKIADKNLYKEKKEKRIRKSKYNEHGEKLKDLLEEIKELRDELNKKVTQEGKDIRNEDTLEISRKLDKLIERYIIEEDER